MNDPDPNRRQAIAPFRYGVIAELLQLPPGGKGLYRQLADKAARDYSTKAIDKLWERIGRLKEKSHGAGQHYHIAITPDPSGTRAQAIHGERQPVEGTLLTHPGVYCLRTNELTWEAEQLWRTYVIPSAQKRENANPQAA